MPADIISFLETKGLVKKYRKRVVVDKVSLSVKGGEIVGLLGPNGAGKTTTFRMVVGLIKSDGGRIVFNGQNITNYPMYYRARLGVGYLPQEPTVFSKLSVRENIDIILETLKFSKQERKEKLESLLEEMSLSHLIDSKAGSLSGGERRRLEIARALVTSPSFLMLDEPFAAIDPKLVENLQEVILKLKDKKIGILITDHKPRETLSITDRTYIIHKGKILKHGESKELAKDEIVKKLYLGKNFSMGDEEKVDIEDILEGVEENKKQGEYDKAIRSLTDVIAFNPGSLKALKLRAECFLANNDFISSKVDLKSILDVNPEDDDAKEMLLNVENILKKELS